MNHSTKNKQIYKGAFALVFAGIIGKVISAFYRIPLQNLTGDIGFYIYQQIYPIIGIAITIALYGFPSAIAKFLAENKAKASKPLSKNIIGVLLLFHVFLFLLIYCFRSQIALWMGDEDLVEALKLVAWIFLFVPILSLLRGIQQSEKRMYLTANSQLIEQLIRACIIIGTAAFISLGYLSVYRIADGAVLATTVAFLASTLYLLFHRKKGPLCDGMEERVFGFSSLWSTIIFGGIVISLNHMLLLLMQFADSVTVVPGLVEYGLSTTEAMKAKGVIDRGQPLLQLVTVVGSSFAMALMPEITKQNWHANKKQAFNQIQSSLKFCLLLSVGATAGLWILMPEINQLLFTDRLGSNSLRILALTLLVSPLTLVVASLLQGFGYMKWTAFLIFFGLWVKILLNKWFVPSFGISGNALATVCTIVVIFVINYWLLRKRVIKQRLLHLPLLRLILATGLLIAIECLLKFLNNNLLHLVTRLELVIFVLFSVVLGFLVFLFSLRWLNILTKEEWNQLPMPKKWNYKGVNRDETNH